MSRNRSHQCLRYGHRQTRRALGSAPRSARFRPKPTFRKPGVPDAMAKRRMPLSSTPGRIKQPCTNAFPIPFPTKTTSRMCTSTCNITIQMAMGDGQDCVKEFNLEEFCRTFKYFPVPAHSALKILTQAGYLEYTDEQDNASRIIFSHPPRRTL